MDVERMVAGLVDDAQQRRRPRWKAVWASMSSIVVGAIVGCLICVLNVVLAYKVGTAFGGAVVITIVGVGILRLVGSITWRSMLLLYSTASGGSVAISALDSTLGASLLGGGRLPGFSTLVLLGLVSNLVGVLIGAAAAPYVTRSSALRFPALQPAIDLMKTLMGGLGSGSNTGRLMAYAAAAGAAVTAGGAFAAVDTLSLPALPVYYGISISPLLFGLGLRLGGKAAFWLAAGALYSVAVWHMQDFRDPSATSTSFPAHLGSPWILAAGVGVLVGFGVSPLIRAMSGLLPLRTKLLGRYRWGVVAVIAIAVGAYLTTDLGHNVSMFITVSTATVVLLAALCALLNRINAEVGLVPLSVAQYLCVIAFSLIGLGVLPTYLLAGTICCAAIASVYTVEAAKVCDMSAADRPLTRWSLVGTQLAGSVVGTLSGVTVLVMLARTGSVGTPQFPAPVAAATQFISTAARDTRSYSEQGWSVLAVAATVGVALAWTPAQPTLLGLGILLPPSTSLTAAIGGLTAALIARLRPALHPAVATVGSGLIVGGGLTAALIVSIRALAF